MINVYGWVVISFADEFISELEENQAANKIAAILATFNQTNQFAELKQLNGTLVVYIGLAHNHTLDYIIDIEQLMQAIVAIAALSYGVVHVLLSDELEQYDFNTLRLARGKITRHIDPMLLLANE